MLKRFGHTSTRLHYDAGNAIAHPRVQGHGGVSPR